MILVTVPLTHGFADLLPPDGGEAAIVGDEPHVVAENEGSKLVQGFRLKDRFQTYAL